MSYDDDDDDDAMVCRWRFLRNFCVLYRPIFSEPRAAHFRPAF